MVPGRRAVSQSYVPQVASCHREGAERHLFLMTSEVRRNHDFRYLAAGHLFHLSGLQCIHQRAIMAAIAAVIRV